MTKTIVQAPEIQSDKRSLGLFGWTRMSVYQPKNILITFITHVVNCNCKQVAQRPGTQLFLTEVMHQSLLTSGLVSSREPMEPFEPTLTAIFIFFKSSINFFSALQ